LQNPSHTKGDNLNNIRQENNAGRKMKNAKDNVNEFERNSKNTEEVSMNERRVTDLGLT
jgi:hypothetical protein